MNNNIMTRENAREYHNLINKLDRTKEENRQLETLKKVAKMQGYIEAINNIANLKNVNILEYDSVQGLYRLQLEINGRFKTIARIKIAKRDVYILVRETTAREIGKEYEIINYNLPAGYHVENNLYNELLKIVEYHNSIQAA